VGSLLARSLETDHGAAHALTGNYIRGGCLKDDPMPDDANSYVYREGRAARSSGYTLGAGLNALAGGYLDDPALKAAFERGWHDEDAAIASGAVKPADYNWDKELTELFGPEKEEDADDA
jgi:hypothetical protein